MIFVITGIDLHQSLLLLVQNLLIAGVEEFLLGRFVFRIELVCWRKDNVEIQLLEEVVQIRLILGNLLGLR